MFDVFNRDWYSVSQKPLPNPPQSTVTHQVPDLALTDLENKTPISPPSTSLAQPTKILSLAWHPNSTLQK